MNGPWRDPETGTVVEFGSSYQGESSYSMKGGVIGPYPQSARFRTGLHSPETPPTPTLAAWYDDKPPTIAALAVWERYCQASRDDYTAWCAARGYEATS